jgi:hypothetical protein
MEGSPAADTLVTFSDRSRIEGDTVAFSEGGDIERATIAGARQHIA